MRLLFDFLHNCVVHPLLFWTRDSGFANRLHNWTAAKAWPDEIICWCVPEASMEFVDQTRDEIREALLDPEYTVITNTSLYFLRIPKNAVVTAEDQSADETDWLRVEIEKAKRDPTYILVVPFDISVFPVPSKSAA